MKDIVEISNAMQLATGLQERMEKDYSRMDRWRRWHRLTALLYAVITISVPAIVAAGLVPDKHELIKKALLILVAVTAGLNTAFKPALHSAIRRSDTNNSRELFDRYRGELAGAAGKAEAVLPVYQKYSELFGKMYHDRGAKLVESTLEQGRDTTIHKGQGKPQ